MRRTSMREHLWGVWLFVLLSSCGSGDKLPSIGSGYTELHQGFRRGSERHFAGAPTQGFAKQFAIIGSGVQVAGIDNATDVTGCSGATAILYSRNQVQPLSIGGQSSSCGTGIASPGLGQDPLVSGWATFTNTGTSGVLWHGTTGQTLTNFTPGNALGVDAAGDLAGLSGPICYVSCYNDAVVQPHSGIPIRPIPGAVAFGVETQISDGTLAAVGESYEEAFFLDYDGHTSYPSMIPFGKIPSAAVAINSLGLIVGTISSKGFAAQIVSYDQPPNIAYSLDGTPTSLNSYNEIVGFLQKGNASTPVLWKPTAIKGGGDDPESYDVVDLTSSIPKGWSDVSFYGINDHEQITGNGTYNGTTSSFILSRYRQGVDVSYPAGEVENASFEKLLATGPYWNQVVVGLLCKKCGAGGINPYAYQTLQNAADATMPAAAYVILDFRDPKGNTGSQQMHLAEQAFCDPDGGTCINPLDLKFLAIDVECGQTCSGGGLFGHSTAADIQKIISDAVEAAPKGLAIVIYSARAQWNAHLGSWAGKKPRNPYSVCGLWDAVKDDVDDLGQTSVEVASHIEGFVPRPLYGGWKARFGKQYEFNDGFDAGALEKYAGIKSLDLDTFLWTEPPSKSPCGGSGKGGPNRQLRSYSSRAH